LDLDEPLALNWTGVSPEWLMFRQELTGQMCDNWLIQYKQYALAVKS
jgi:hypothetical protein